MTDAALEPTEIVEAFLDAFIAMDFDTALTFLADDCEYTNIPMGTVRGHAGVREVLGPFFAPIHEGNNVNLGQPMAGYAVLERLHGLAVKAIGEFFDRRNVASSSFRCKCVSDFAKEFAVICEDGSTNCVRE